jgi:hypothetical protein
VRPWPLKKLLISALEKNKINGILPDFIKGAFVCISLSLKQILCQKTKNNETKM